MWHGFAAFYRQTIVVFKIFKLFCVTSKILLNNTGYLIPRCRYVQEGFNLLEVAGIYPTFKETYFNFAVSYLTACFPSINPSAHKINFLFFVQYHDTLTTESEIFLSLLMKFLDPDKPSWQNGSALEVIHKIVVRYLLQLVPFARHDLYLCLVVSHIFNFSFNLI